MRTGALWFRLLATLGASIVVTAAAWAGFATGLLRDFDLQLGDRYLGEVQPHPDVVVLGIDARALECVGQWPWSRQRQAEALDAVAVRRPRLLAYNVLLAPPAPGDAELAGVLGRAGVAVLPFGVEKIGAGEQLRVAEATTEPSPQVASAVFALGFANVVPDSDGVVRETALVLERTDRRIASSLSLAALAGAEDLPLQPIVRGGGGVQVGDRLVKSVSTDLRINFAPRLRVHSLASVLPADSCRGAGDEALPDLAGKVVFVGLADQATERFWPVPTNKQPGIPSVLVHANATNTMMTGAYLEPARAGVTIPWAFASALLAFAAAALLPLWLSAIAGVAIVALGWLVVAESLVGSEFVPRPLYPLLAAAFAYLLGVAFHYVIERVGRERATGFFGQFVPRPVVDRLLGAGGDRELAGGVQADVTTFFCDLRGFTAMAAQMDPDAVRDVLNVYYDQVGRIIALHRGTLMQYVGDEVFAVFGTPVTLDDHAAAALACARDVQAVEADLAAQVERLGSGPLRYGIGLNSGSVIASAVGSGHRQYSVVGDTVNVGSRLCALAEAGEVVLSEAVLSRLDTRPDVEWLGPVELKGVAEGFRAYRLPTGTKRTRKPAAAKARRVSAEPPPRRKRPPPGTTPSRGASASPATGGGTRAKASRPRPRRKPPA